MLKITKNTKEKLTIINKKGNFDDKSQINDCKSVNDVVHLTYEND